MAAKFIQLPIGGFDAKSKEFQRTPILVNLDRIIKIVPEGETACKVTLAGGNVLGVCRRYDTLSAQILNREDLAKDFPDEEIVAAFEAGYNKAKSELNTEQYRAALVKSACKIAASWFDNHPLSVGWQSQFRRDLKEMLNDEQMGTSENNDNE